MRAVARESKFMQIYEYILVHLREGCEAERKRTLDALALKASSREKKKD